MLDKSTKQKNLFKVPENYFENFNADIMDMLPEKNNNTAKIVPLWRKVLPWTAIAAVLCGLIFSVGLFNQENNAIADLPIKDTVPETHLASSTVQPTFTATSVQSSEEEDFYQYLKDESTRSNYRDMIYNDN